MKVGLLDVDNNQKFPNLPLMKLSAYHKNRGDEVELFNPMFQYDLVYQQKIFSEEYYPHYQYHINADEVRMGGTGYDLTNKLQAEIEHIYPDYSLFPELTKNTAYGFLTRGCPRGCSFCIVQQKEGCISKQVADLKEFWRGQKEIKLLDPNITACKNKENLFKQLIDSKAYIDFTQGIDARLLTKEDCQLINKMKIKMIHFAWDFPEQDLRPYLANASKYIDLDSRKKRVYVLTNYGSDLQEDLYRIYWLRENGFDPYVMVCNKWEAPKEIRRLQRWVNMKAIFRSVENFEDYV